MLDLKGPGGEVSGFFYGCAGWLKANTIMSARSIFISIRTMRLGWKIIAGKITVGWLTAPCILR